MRLFTALILASACGSMPDEGITPTPSPVANNPCHNSVMVISERKSEDAVTVEVCGRCAEGRALQQAYGREGYGLTGSVGFWWDDGSDSAAVSVRYQGGLVSQGSADHEPMGSSVWVSGASGFGNYTTTVSCPSTGTVDWIMVLTYSNRWRGQ